MPQLDDNEKRRLFMTLDLHTKQNEKIERGLYGDEQNKVKGLMERVERLEIWVANQTLKTAYTSGVVAGSFIIIKVMYDYFSK